MFTVGELGVSIGNFAVIRPRPPSSVLLERSQEVLIINTEKMGTKKEERKGASDLGARGSEAAMWCDQVGSGRKESWGFFFIYILL